MIGLGQNQNKVNVAERTEDEYKLNSFFLMEAILQHIDDACCTLSSSVSSITLPIVDHFSDTHKDIAPIIFSNCLPFSSGNILSDVDVVVSEHSLYYFRTTTSD